VQIDTKATPSIAIPSDLSAESMAGFDERLRDLLRKGPDKIALDSSQLKIVTSSHINVLWQVYQTCADAGVEVKLQSPSAGLVRILKVLDLYDVFGESRDIVYTRLKEAVKIESVDGAETYADEFRANVGSINDALDEFLRFLKRLCLHEITEYELRSVFYEVVTNIRTHANIEGNDLIVFTCRADESKILLVFADSGIPFDLTSVTADFDLRATARNGQTRGFGITLIRMLTDTISYTRRDDVINVLTLKKKWNQ